MRGEQIRPAPFLGAHSEKILPAVAGSFGAAVQFGILKYTKYSCDPKLSSAAKSLADHTTISFGERALGGYRFLRSHL